METQELVRKVAAKEKNERHISFGEPQISEVTEDGEIFTRIDREILNESNKKSGTITYEIHSQPVKFIYLTNFHVHPRGEGLGKAAIKELLSDIVFNNGGVCVLKDDTKNEALNNKKTIGNFYSDLGFRSLFSNDESGKMKVFGDITKLGPSQEYLLNKYFEYEDN